MQKTFRLSPIALTLSEGDQPPEKIQVIRTGTFHHPTYGKFEVTPAHLLAFKKNFDDNVRKIDIALDYGHDSEGEAAAWFKELVLSDDGTELWAKPEWTPDGAAAVLGKKFRYISADFSFDYQDNETLKKHGPVLLGAGLTNRPVVKGQAPVIELAEGKGNDVQEMEALKAENEGLKKKLAELEGKVQAGMKPNEELQKQLEEANKKLGEYAEKEKKAGEEKMLAEKKASFDLKLSEGKVCEAQREPFMKGDMDAFLAAAQPVKLSQQGDGGEPKVEAKDKQEAETKVLELAEKAVADKRSPSKREAISLVLSENPDLRKKIEG